ncbi:hypothetical protein MASR2M66_01130 [Chloroflexota bacterium]
MNGNQRYSSTVFSRAWDIISKDDTIPPDEKKAILKLIQVIVEAREQFTDTKVDTREEKSITHEIISKHSLMMTVKHQADELDALKRISLNLTSTLNLQKVLDTLVSEVMSLVKDAYNVHIFLYEHGALTFGASLNDKGDRNISFEKPRNVGLTYSVANTGKPIMVEDMQSHPLYKGSIHAFNGSIIGVPIKFKNEILGVMNLSKSVIGRFTRSELRLISLLADQAAVAIFNANMYKQISQMANTDSVTGLPNRRALDERLQEEWTLSRQTHQPFTVVMMDLDGFKNVNDTFGHDLGDKLLHSLFNFLAQHMRSEDFLARFGGDELTLVMRNTGVEAAQVVTQKVLGLMQTYRYPYPDNKTLNLGMTAGVAVYPIHAETPSDLIRAADAALYYAKKYNRGSYAIAKGVTSSLDPLRLKE